MRRDLSMVRRLEKIEKELGYCEIKLEKAQRLRTQLQFLKEHRKSLEAARQGMEARLEGTSPEGNRLGGLPLLEVYHRVSLQRESSEAEEIRELFRSNGAFPFIRDECEILDREILGIEEKLGVFGGFVDKKGRLVQERNDTLHLFNAEESEPVHQISEEFERIEQTWNVLTEDLINLDEAIFNTTRAADYLLSARSFVLSSRSQFSIESWLRGGFLIDLFKHSTVGRAKQMVEGADRNLKLALMELICLEDVPIHAADFEHLLLPFLDALFEDLFVHGKLTDTLALVEQRLERTQDLVERLQTRREVVLDDQHRQEESRVRLFQQIGDERRKLTL